MIIINWLTVITTLIAAIAPTVVAIVSSKNQSKINAQNNEFQLKINNQNNLNQLELKKFDSYYAEKNEIISNYIDNLIVCIHYPYNDNLVQLEKIAAKAVLYVSDDAYKEVTAVIDGLSHLKNDQISDYLKIHFRQFISAINQDNIQNNKKD